MKFEEQYQQIINKQINEGKFARLAGCLLVGLNATFSGCDASDFTPDMVKVQRKEFMQDKKAASILYRAIEQAETGSQSNPWIRTKYQPAGGSTAYGPVQITKGLIETAISNHGSFYSKHKKYIDKFLKQGENFAKYGGKDMVKGFERYDYGGEGDLTSSKDKSDYTKMAYDLIKIIFEDSKGDLLKFIEDWRGVSYDKDPRYYNEVIQYINSHYK